MAVVDKLIEILCRERGERPIVCPQSQKDSYWRALVNVRPPAPLSEEYIALEGQYLGGKLAERGVVNAEELQYSGNIALWKGDITRLKADAIVNAANSQMLGCFVPCHGCIDNAIHTYAGVQLRAECARVMSAQKEEEPTGSAKITKAYNLPCHYVLHTVGPIIYGRVTKTDRELLAGCYRSCLELAAAYGLKSIAFCCISTGEFHFPNQEAACIAVRTVRQYLDQTHSSIRRVIFNVFKDTDREIYQRLLG